MLVSMSRSAVHAIKQYKVKKRLQSLKGPFINHIEIKAQNHLLNDPTLEC